MRSGVGKPENAGGLRGASGPGELWETQRGMMDGSHARHCEKIIVRCCQVRQCGGRPKPWKNKGPGSSVWRAPACLRSPEPLRIYMRRSRVNCSEFLRWVQSRGRCCLILHNKHTVSTHSSLFQRTASQKCQRIWTGYKSKSQNKPIIVCFIVKQLRGERRESCFNRNIWRIFKRKHMEAVWQHMPILGLYILHRHGAFFLNRAGGSPRKTWKFHTFLQLPVSLGNDLYWISFSGNVRALLAAGGLRGLFIKLDLVFTVVDGQKPRCVKAATAPDFLFFFVNEQCPVGSLGLAELPPCTSKYGLTLHTRWGLD